MGKSIENKEMGQSVKRNVYRVVDEVGYIIYQGLYYAEALAEAQSSYYSTLYTRREMDIPYDGYNFGQMIHVRSEKF